MTADYQNLSCSVCGKHTGYNGGSIFNDIEYCNYHLIEQIAFNKEFEKKIKELYLKSLVRVVPSDNKLGDMCSIITKRVILKSGILYQLVTFNHAQFVQAFVQNRFKK